MFSELSPVLQDYVRDGSLIRSQRDLHNHPQNVFGTIQYMYEKLVKKNLVLSFKEENRSNGLLVERGLQLLEIDGQQRDESADYIFILFMECTKPSDG